MLSYAPTAAQNATDPRVLCALHNSHGEYELSLMVGQDWECHSHKTGTPAVPTPESVPRLRTL
jgi:hypothetical protein